MPRRPRIEMAGFHHVVNRGVEQRNVFLNRKDYETFLKLLCEVCTQYHVTLHSYCLMSNHYHLLLETEHENLSKVMRSINSQYASYFNRKEKRVGHLWQGRFKSWYVTDESYLYSLIRYIEHNPIKAKIVKSLDAYPYSSYGAFSEQSPSIPCLKASLMFNDFNNRDDRVSFFESGYDEEEIKTIAKHSNLVLSSAPKETLDNSFLFTLFKDAHNKELRDKNIKKAIDMGFSQHSIAAYLKISQPTVSYILKKANHD